MIDNVMKYSTKGALALFAVLAVLLIPVLAFAVPGSGEFVSVYSGTGREITELYNIIAKICLAVLIVVEGVLLYAIIRFRRRDDDELPVQNHGDLRLEFGWTMAALIIQVYIGVLTINVMFSTEVIPDDVDMTVEAIAYQWDWQFVYPDQDGLVHSDLVVPANKTIKLEVTSRDVIHAIFIPELGVKIDAVPGRFNYWWFVADGPIGQTRVENFATVGRPERTLAQTRQSTLRATGRDATARPVSGLEQAVRFLGASPGRRVDPDVISPYAAYNAKEYQGLCAELCGFGHWDMYFRTVVMTPSSFDRWVRDMQTQVREVSGEAVYAGQCSVCHGADGDGVGNNPTLIGADIVANPDRANDHIELVLKGVAPMPAFGNILNDAEIAAVVNHERVSWGNAGGTVESDDVAALREALGLPAFPAGGAEPIATDDLLFTGERLYRSCVTCHGADGVGPDYIPNLAGSELVLGDTTDLARVLIEGRDLDQWPGAKTPLARSMTDMQLASLLTYLRQSFGNEASEVQPFEVEEIRRELN